MAGILAALVVACVLATTLPGLPADWAVAVDDIATIVSALLAAALSWLVALHVGSARESWAWRLLALGFLSNAVAETAWSYYDLIAHTEVPSPSLADLFYVLFYPAAFVGVLLLVRRRDGSRLTGWTVFLDAVAFTLGLAGLTWQLVLSPSLAGAEADMSGYIALAYPALDLFLVFALAVLLLRWELERVEKPVFLILASFVAMVIADLVYAWVALKGEYEGASPLDPLWVLSYSLLGFAALARLREPSRTARGEPSETERHIRTTIDLSGARLLRVAMPYLSFPAVAFLFYLRLSQNSVSLDLEIKAIITLAQILFGVVMLRQFLTIVENTRLSHSLGEFSRNLEARVEDRTSELAALNRTATSLSNCLTVEDVLATSLDLALETTHTEAGLLWVLRPGGGAELAARRGTGDGIPAHLGSLSPEDPWLVEMTAARTPILAGPADALHTGLIDRSGEGHIDAEARLLLVPLLARGEIVGILGLFVSPPVDDPARLQLAQSIGAQLGVALENARQYDATRYLAERDSLTELPNHRALHLRLDQELHRSKRSKGPFSITMMDLDGFKLFNDTYGHPIGDEILRLVASVLGETLRASDVVGRSGGDEFMAILSNTDARGALEQAHRVRAKLAERPWISPQGVAVPVRLSFGIAEFPHDGHSVNDLIGMADSNLYRSKGLGGDAVTTGDSGRAGWEGSRGSTFDVLDGLVTAVDNKDRYTRRHSEEVTDLSLAIAERLSLSNESKRALRIAGLLHDVGKIGVPDSILRRPGPLNEEETQVIRQHALLGELIIKDVPHLNEVVAAVGAHHERYDGGGYPRGLRGEEIPTLGRILAVADSYSAMTSDRPYRKAMSAVGAREEIARGAGTQFDPVVADALIACLLALGMDSDDSRAILPGGVKRSPLAWVARQAADN